MPCNCCEMENDLTPNPSPTGRGGLGSSNKNPKPLDFGLLIYASTNSATAMLRFFARFFRCILIRSISCNVSAVR